MAMTELYKDHLANWVKAPDYSSRLHTYVSTSGSDQYAGLLGRAAIVDH